MENAKLKLVKAEKKGGKGIKEKMQQIENSCKDGQY